jgi:hypothetical protein
MNTNNRKFNNIRWTVNKIQQLKNYLQDNIQPVPFPKHLREQFNAFTLDDNRYFKLKDTGQIVIPENQKQAKIKEIYDEYGLGSGRDLITKS